MPRARNVISAELRRAHAPWSFPMLVGNDALIWDVLGNDPTAVLTFSGYARGDILVASGTNQMSVMSGNNQSARKFLGMSGDGDTSLTVTGLRGKPVSPTVPADGQVLQYSALATPGLPRRRPPAG